MTHDEVLVELLRNVVEVEVRAGQRVFHLEVFQKENSQSQYPCVVYRLTDSIPEKELAGNNGYSTAVYDVYVITTTSDDLRAIAREINNFGDDTFQPFIWNNPDYSFVEGIDVDTETEEDEFAIQQQEQGYKIATLSVSITYSDCS